MLPLRRKAGNGHKGMAEILLKVMDTISLAPHIKIASKVGTALLTSLPMNKTIFMLYRLF